MFVDVMLRSMVVAGMRISITRAITDMIATEWSSALAGDTHGYEHQDRNPQVKLLTIRLFHNMHTWRHSALCWLVYRLTSIRC